MTKVKKLSKAEAKKATDAADMFATALIEGTLSSKSKVTAIDNFGDMLTYSKALRELAEGLVKRKEALHLIALGVFVIEYLHSDQLIRALEDVVHCSSLEVSVKQSEDVVHSKSV